MNLVKMVWGSLLLHSLVHTGVVAVEEFLPPQCTTGVGCFREGEVVNYTCTVVDSGGTSSTEWTGTAFDCDRSPRNTIALFSRDFGTDRGAMGDCSNGALVARSIGVSGDEYTSVLTVNVSRSFDGQTVICGLLGGATPVGNDTLQVGVVPGTPVNPVCDFPVPGQRFTVSWSPLSGGVVGGAEYNVMTTGDCGSCTTSGLMTSCSGWTARGQTCTFTAQTITTDCGFISEMSETETVVLRVPPRPSVTSMPTYSATGLLLSIRIEIPESQFAIPGVVCRGVSGVVTRFLLEYTSSSGTICSSRQLQAGCDDGVCVDVFNVTSDCPGDSYAVRVCSVNIVGPGPTTQNVVSSSITLLTVSVDVSRRVLTCQFADVGNISCSIHYRNDPGCVQNNGTDMNSASSGTVLILTLPEDLIENGLHCYTVTASSGGQTVKVVGEFRTACVRLAQPNNGAVTFTNNSLLPGTIASYSCSTSLGYEMVGEEALLCQNDGEWSGESPVCRCIADILPVASINNARMVSVECISAEYSVQTGYCPSTFTATFNISSSQWQYPSTSICTGTAVGITFVLTFIFSLALGIIIGVISVYLYNKFRKRPPTPDGDVELRDTPAAAAIYEEPEVMKKETEDIETSGNVAYGPVHTRR